MAGPTDAQQGAAEVKESLWRVEPARSRVGFQTGWMFGLLQATGTFEWFAGSMVLRDDGSLAGALSVGSASVKTGNRLRDHDLKGRFFLDCRHYPTMKFVSSNFTAAEGRFTGVGSLTARNRTVEVPAQGVIGHDDEQMTLSTRVAVHVPDFGWPTAFGYIRRTLLLTVELALRRYE